MAEDDQLTFDINSRSEFPSLSSAQPQHHAQAAWGNPNQRTTSHLPSHPLQATGGGTASATPPHVLPPSSHAQAPHPQHQESMFSPSSFVGGLDDVRYGGTHNVVGQPLRSAQPKTGSIEEFPPLGRSPTGENDQEKRSSLMPGGEVGDQLNGGGLSPGLNLPQGLQGQGDLLGATTGLLEGGRHGGFTAGRMGSIGFDVGGMACRKLLERWISTVITGES